MGSCAVRNLPIAAILAVLLPCAAHAGAWTQKAHHAQIIAETTWSNAANSFDSSGVASRPALFEKWLSTFYAEYGWNDRLTLILAPEYAHARVGAPGGGITTANDFAVEAGVRYRITNAFGVLSVEADAKTAGAYAMSVSADRAAGRQLEARLLYGTNFRLFRHNGFADFEGGYRWIAGARPDEFPVDITLGLQVTHRTLILAQSFNIIASNNAQPPYQYYRQHKLELSTVTRLSNRISVQSGAFISPVGQNSLVERGAVLALWVNL